MDYLQLRPPRRPKVIAHTDRVVPEARLDQTEHGLVPSGDGWFVVNAREAPWWYASGRGAVCVFEGDKAFEQVGVNIWVLGPGEPIGMYHWEAAQEDFLVVAGEGVLIVEGEERPLRPWDFVHCAPHTKHIIVGAGSGPCVVVGLGSRTHEGPDWGGYTVDETARRHGASVDEETTDAKVAYADVPRREATPYRDGWLPE